MRKLCIILLLCFISLVGCEEEPLDVGEKVKNAEEPSLIHPPKDHLSAPKQEVPNLQLDRSSFHSIIGWLNDKEILFVLVEKGKWTVQAYSIDSGNWRVIYETDTPIIQVELHPSKSMLMLHTSKNSSSADVLLVNIDGELEQSLHFESAEMYMNWHPTNPQLIVFSAFYEDWSFNSFVYDGETKNLEAIDVENPFVKWYDDQHLMLFEWKESNLDGSDLVLYSIKEKEKKETKWKNMLDVIYMGDTYLFIQIDEEAKEFRYELTNKDSAEKFEWITPALSNYSEWIIPNLSILSPNQVMMLQPTKGGNVDSIQQENILTNYSLSGKKELGKIESLPIDCSPSGDVCLGGYEKQIWIQTEPFQEKNWVEIDES